MLQSVTSDDFSFQGLIATCQAAKLLQFFFQALDVLDSTTPEIVRYLEIVYLEMATTLMRVRILYNQK